MHEYIIMIYYVVCAFHNPLISDNDNEFPSDGIDRSLSHNESFKNWKGCSGVIRHQGILPHLQNQDTMELTSQKWEAVWRSG